ncbi:class I SAM-dependent methyltransferase [Domibacillus robiginosus]|uniref:class I SAM-dependent methyltransferase n=1 Tax=Domibacillus robiginosus TaxID=1071054 RepID=UPI00067E25CD
MNYLLLNYWLLIICLNRLNLAKLRKLDTEFFVRDVTNIELPSNSVDTVFIFGILHHVTKWQTALQEINRVLKNDDIFLVEE